MKYHLRMTDEEVRALREQYIKSAKAEAVWREALMVCDIGFVRKMTRFVTRMADDDRIEMRKTYDMAASDEAIRQDIRDKLASTTKVAADLDRNIADLRVSLFNFRRSRRLWPLHGTTYAALFTLSLGYLARWFVGRSVKHYHRLAEKEL